MTFHGKKSGYYDVMLQSGPGAQWIEARQAPSPSHGLKQRAHARASERSRERAPGVAAAGCRLRRAETAAVLLGGQGGRAMFPGEKSGLYYKFLKQKKIPTSPGLVLETSDCSETPDPVVRKHYCSILAKVQFAAHWIQCDISYAAAQLARFCASAGR